MKKILLSLFVFAVAGYGARLQAQCTIIQTNVAVQVVGTPVVLGPNKCQFTINTQFDLQANNGFKYLFFHSWLTADYPATPIFDCTNSNSQNPGTAAQLGTAVDAIGKSFLDYGFLNIVLPVNSTPVPLTFATSFLHDATVVLTQPSNSTGIAATIALNPDGTYHFSITNIKIIVNQSCGATLNTRTDIWGSNSNATDPKAQCYICGVSNSINDPAITGFRNCDNPRKYAVGINTVDPVAKNVTYKVYLDVNNNGTLDGGDQLAFTSGTISISSSSSYSSGLVSLPAPYSNTQPWSEYNYLILVEGPNLANSVLTLFSNSCSPLPVKLKSFTANRSNSNVELKWTTSTEQNNRGFELQRLDGAGGWNKVIFVSSKADGGNSNSDLTYTYNDINTTKGVSQYRLMQVDFDAQVKYSDIRSVRGEGQAAKTLVFPNPSSNGNVKVVFEDVSGSRDASLMDINGRTIQQWKNINGNTLMIENLVVGMYNLRIINRETGEQTIEKIIVSKK